MTDCCELAAEAARMREKKQAHVICCNDSVEAVHLGTAEEAQAAIEPLARAYYERDKWHWIDRARSTRWPDNPYYAYRDYCHWHVHTVKVIE